MRTIFKFLWGRGGGGYTLLVFLLDVKVIIDIFSTNARFESRVNIDTFICAVLCTPCMQDFFTPH